MPLNHLTSAFTDAVPAWLLTGVVIAGGFAFEQASQQNQRTAVVETKVEGMENDVQETRAAVTRIEMHLMGKSNE